MGIDQQRLDRTDVELDGSGMKIALVCGRFNDLITKRLLDGAMRGLESAQVSSTNIVVEWVPGAFEIPFAAKVLAQQSDIDAVIGVGCVIRGETGHYDIVAGECARGVQTVQIETLTPVIFGVLTTEDLQQALDRSGDAGTHNVGEEAGLTAVEMVQLKRRYQT